MKEMKNNEQTAKKGNPGKAGSNRRNKSSQRKSRDNASCGGGNRRNSQFGNNSNHSYGGNDLSWYNQHPELLISASRFPFVNRPGANLPDVGVVAGNSINSGPANKLPNKLPGIMKINWIPSVGAAHGKASDAINISARQLYMNIRKAYSGSLPADAPDMMVYVLALDSLYSLYERLKRAYYITGLFSPYNENLPAMMLKADGFDADDMRNNYDKVYASLVIRANQLSALPVPDEFSIFKRHQFLSSNIYADTPSVKAQLYIFSQKYYWKFAEQADKGSGLVYREAKSDQVDANTFAMWLSLWDEMYDALVNWDTSLAIQGQILRAYENQPLVRPEPIVLNGVLQPIYNYEVLTQIHNICTTPVNISDGTAAVVQNPLTNNLFSVQVPLFNTVNNQYFAQGTSPSISLDFDKDTTPESGDIVIASRLASSVKFGTKDDEGTEGWYIRCGTEIVPDIYVYTGYEGDIGTHHFMVSEFRLTTTYVQGKTPDMDNKDILRLMSLMCTISSWSMAPVIKFYVQNADDSFSYNWFGNVNNVTAIIGADAARLNDICIYSEFNSFPQ